jgi:membrane-associated phospholipid phosphatase
MRCNLQYCWRTSAPHGIVDGCRIRPLVIDLAACRGVESVHLLAAASGYPLVDGALTKLDATLFGFEWSVEANWVANHPALDWLLQRAYFSLYYQGALVFLVGSITRPGDRNGEIIWQFCISLVLTCAIFVFTPALGHVAHIGTDWMKTLTMIRNGEWADLDFSHVEGIISFPSFHTTLAILLVYAVRDHRWLLAVFVPLNMLLIVATLSVGGHYFVDPAAGAAVAFVSIAATRLLRQQLAKDLPRTFLDLAAAASGLPNRIVRLRRPEGLTRHPRAYNIAANDRASLRLSGHQAGRPRSTGCR